MANAPKLVRGIYVPTPTFFKDDADQSLDLKAHEEHILWLAKAGVQGFVVQGSTGEAVCLTPDERNQITAATRKVLNDNGFEKVLVIAGAGAQNVGEAVSLSKDAHKSGASHVLILPPAFFSSTMTQSTLVAYYTEVADKSPVPVLIYSFPAVSGGVEISSDTFAVLAKHPNIAGVKQTDNLVGKMARNVWLNQKEDFIVVGGGSDYLIAAYAVGVSGAITGMANIVPRVILKLTQLWDEGKFDEARDLQGKLSAAEWAMLSGGIPGIKASVLLFLGRGGVPRRPVPPAPESVLIKQKTEIASIFELEKKLWADAGVPFTSTSPNA